MVPPDRPTMNDLAAAAGARSIVCPSCGADVFRATSTWWVIGLNGSRVKRRSRTCRACGYADNETVPAPIRDNNSGNTFYPATSGSTDPPDIE